MTIHGTFNPPPGLASVIRAITALSAPNQELYVVGGTIRDTVLRRDVRDLDLAVDGDAAQFARGVAAELGGHFVEIDEERRIYRIVRDPMPGDGIDHVDVAAQQGTLEQDLRRRDFSINAMAVRAGGQQIIDPLTGLRDLEARLVRMTNAAVFHDDPLRLLRCARIASELGFEVEQATAAEVRAHAQELTDTSPERQRDELARIFCLADAHAGLRLLDTLGLFDVLLPEVALGRGVSQPADWHAYDVFEHNMRTVETLDVLLAPDSERSARAWMRNVLWTAFGWWADNLREHLAEELSAGRNRSCLLRLAGLLHDVGKPATRSTEVSGRIRFFGHADEGATIAARLMRRLRFSTAEIEYVALLVREHVRPVQLAQVGQVPTRRALYRFNRALGVAMPDVLLLALAAAAASRGPALTSEGWTRHVAYMNSLLVRSNEGVGILHAPSFLDGNDVMAIAGIRPGKAVGRLLEALREAEAVGEVASANEARNFVRRLAGDITKAGAGDG